MKTSLKILLLLLALAGAVFGVLYWQKTQVEPPQNPASTEVNYTQLKQHVVDINSSNDLDKAFEKVYDELCFLKDEGLIDDAQRDEQLRALADAYAPQFASNALSALHNDWTYNDLKRLTDRAKLLSSLTSTQGDAIIVDHDVKEKFSIISKVNSDYAKANALASRTTFSNVTDAKERINSASRYRSDTYLSHCPALVARLKSLPTKIGHSHYLNVSAAVNNLARNYRNYSDIRSKKSEVSGKISAYEGMTRYYGRNEGSSALYTKLRNVPESEPSYEL